MRSRILLAALFLLVGVPLLLAPADRATLEGLALRQILGGEDGLLAALQKAREEGPAHPLDPRRRAGLLRLAWPLAAPGELPEHLDAVRSALRVPEVQIVEGGELLEAPLPGLDGPEALELRVAVSPEGDAIRLLDVGGAPVLLAPGGGEARARLGNRWSLLPPLCAIFLAFLLRRTVPALLLGVLLGTGLLATAGGASLLAAPWVYVTDILLPRILTDAFRLYILGFVLLLSATVAVVTRMGGIEGMVRALVRFARTPRSAQGVAMTLGLGIFFDDYANTIVVGNSAAPLFDRLKVSRARLAYIVDSTAAPVAGLAMLSTWVAYEVSTYASQLPTIGLPESAGYAIFLDTLPYRFYCFLALALVALTIFMGRDVGPMLAAERRARRGEDTGTLRLRGRAAEVAPGVPPRAWNGVLPIFLLVAVTALLIWRYGARALTAAAAAGDDEATAALAAGGGTWIRAVLAASDSTRAIFFGSVAALASAALLALGQRLLRPREVLATAVAGLGGLKDAVVILILAWSIGEVCSDLATAPYLVAVAQDLMAPAWLPTVLFVTSCFVAFATGSSWATMAIMEPNVVLLAHRLGAGTELGSHGLLVLSIGAVLEGSIFGDHCSPISDTTILSSAASGCDHLEHVRTQAPYALLAAALALLLGYVPVAVLGASPWLCLGLSILALLVLLRLAGRRPEPAAGPS